MAAADRAWLGLAAYVLVYDVLCPPAQTLSEGADRYMLTHPWLTRAVAVAIAAHVCNAVPARYDPIHLTFTAARARRGSWTSARSRRKSTPGCSTAAPAPSL